jgi:hypothetical protein
MIVARLTGVASLDCLKQPSKLEVGLERRDRASQAAAQRGDVG